MKTKFIIMSALLAGIFGTASAQEKCDSSKDCCNNFFISVGAGIQGTVNPDTKFGNSITPLVNVSVGKYITPVWGVRGQVYGWSSKMVTNYPFASVNAPAVERKENYFGINVDGMINLSALFAGYNPDRAVEFSFFAGPSMNVVGNYSGWIPGYDEIRTPVDGGTKVEHILNPDKCEPAGHAVRYLVGASVGLGAKYNVSPSFSIDLDVRGQVTPSILGAYSSGKTDGYVYANLGVTYTIGGRKFANPRVAEARYNEAIKDAQQQIIAAKEETIKAKEQVAEARKQADEAVAVAAAAKADTVTLVVAGHRSVFFKIGSSKIDDYSKVNLKQAAEIMKQNPEKCYKIMGYADAATGSKAYNTKLSQKRAEKVYDFLIGEGVPAEQLEIVVCGPTNDLNWSDELRRVVVIE